MFRMALVLQGNKKDNGSYHLGFRAPGLGFRGENLLSQQ